MLRYRVEEMSLGPYFEWARRAADAYAQVPGLIEWRVLKRRTGPIEFTEIFTWRDRDAFMAASKDPGFEKTTDTLLEALGQLVDMDSVEFSYHDVVARAGRGE
ncbi:MAG: hypothetical protein D6729_05360 [Deltaproteobacteria bacterium]|nr:MAG: hypothetical protein D6729_05360 [Deltaproteobacteria bacterium]